MKLFPKVLLASSLVSMLFSCTSEEVPSPEAPNQEEVITDMIFTLVSSDNSDTAVWSFVDRDGEGGNAPVIQEDTLLANTLYRGSIELLNAIDPEDIESINEEILEEDDEHQFFFISTLANATVSYDDMDGNGLPLGLETEIQTGAAENGQLTVILKHQPNKNAEGVSEGDMTLAGGSTDLEIELNIVVE